MRILIDRWYIGPIVAGVVLYCCLAASVGLGTQRLTTLGRAQVDRLYALAEQDKYDVILNSGLASEVSVKYLKMQEQCFGRITAWTVSEVNSTEAVGTRWLATVQVAREWATFHESVGGLDPHHLHVSLASWEDDLGQELVGDPQAEHPGESLASFTVGDQQVGEKVISSDQATDAARGPIHEMDRANIVPPLTARETRDFWIVTDIVQLDTEKEKRFFVLSKSGEPIERVRASGHSFYSSRD